MNRTAQQVFTVLFGRGVVRIAQVVAFLILARLLSPEEFGWFGIITTALAAASILGTLGLRQSLGYHIGQNRLTAGEAAGTALIVWPVLTAISGAAIFFLYGHRIPGTAPIEAAMIIWGGVAGWCLLILFQGIFLGKGDIWQFSASDAAPRFILMILVSALALTGTMSLSNSLWAHVVSFCLPLPFVIALAVRHRGTLGHRLRDLGPMLRYGLIFAFNLFVITLCSRISMFIIEMHGGGELAGQFFAAVRVNEILLEATTAIGLVFFSNAARQTDGASPVAGVARICAWLFWLFIAIGILVALAAPTVIKLLMGGEYADAVPALQIMALSLAPSAASKVIYPTLAGSGRPYFGTPIIVCSLLVNTGLAFLLVPTWGVNGGAAALVAGQFILFFGYIAICRRADGIPVRDFFVPKGAAYLTRHIQVIRGRLGGKGLRPTQSETDLRRVD